VPQSMAQFVLKIEKLSHIMGTAPIVELARAYGLHPRLWLLPYLMASQVLYFKCSISEVPAWGFAHHGVFATFSHIFYAILINA